MSFFRATCPHCGETYTHLFVGSTLHSGHRCPLRDEYSTAIAEGRTKVGESFEKWVARRKRAAK